MVGVTLIATDLDGTILRADGTVSERTVSALSTRVDAGDTVIFVTGRSPGDPLLRLPYHLLSDGRMICANGAVEYDAMGKRMLHVDEIDRAALLETIHFCRDHFPAGRFCLVGTDRIVYDRGHPWIGDHIAPHQVYDDVATAVAEGLVSPFKVTYLNAADSPEAMIASLKPHIGDSVTLTFGSMTNPFFLEIAPRGVTKGTALLRVAASLDIDPADIIAFGDMPNDIPMFEVVGRSFAMGGAHETVVAAASDRTAHVDDDGVAQALESLSLKA